MQIIEKIYPLRFDRGGKAPASTISAALASAPLSPPLSNHGSSPQPFSVSCFIIIWFSLRGMVTSGFFRARIFLPVLAWLMKRVFCIERVALLRVISRNFLWSRIGRRSQRNFSLINDFSLELYMGKIMA